MAESVATAWRNRIVRYGEEAPDQLLAHPRNFRIHPKAQQDALTGALNDLGWIAPVLVNEVTGHVIDGHLRIGLAISKGAPTIPVAYVALDEAEEAEALLTLDPIAAMAVADTGNLALLLEEVRSGEAGVQAMLAELAKASGLRYGDEGPPIDAVPEQFLVMVTCDGETQQAELLDRLTSDGFVCRALVS